MELAIVNADPRYARAKLIEPTRLGYVYVAARVSPGPLAIVLPSAERAKLLTRLKGLAAGLERRDDVAKATVFRAIVMPPAARFSSYLSERGRTLHVADFDIVVLIQTTSPASARHVQATAEYGALLGAIRDAAEFVYAIAAYNEKRIGDVDVTTNGLFLFNHFAADDPGVMLELWDYLAGWYVAETGLDNSVALVPLDGEKSDYAIVNCARWDASPPAHFWRQLSTRSFWSYVRGNLEAHRAASMPIYCRLA